MKVKIKDRKEIAKGMLYVSFDTSGQDAGFTAGQFCSVTLINPPYTDTRGNSRFLGFATSPSNKEAFSILTKIGESAFKKSLMEMPIGTEVEISGIDGRLKLPEDKSQAVVFVAGSVGIAPIMGILRFCHETSWPYKITLIYVNEKRKSTAFLEELENYAKESDNFHLIAVMLADSGWEGEKNNVDTIFIKKYFQQPEKNLYFVTGAPSFVPSVFRQIIAAGVPPMQMKMEIFTGYK